MNKWIGESAQAGTLKDSFKFALGVFLLIIYFLLVQLLVNILFLIIYSLFGVLEPNYMQAFCLMFGAGITVFISWHCNLYRELGEIRRSMENPTHHEKNWINLFLAGLKPQCWY